MKSSTLIVLVALFLISICNVTFFSLVAEVYPLSPTNIPFLASLVLVFGLVPVLFLSLVCYKYTIKPVLVVILMTSSFAAYFMDSYNVVINEDMIQNIVQTNMTESMDLLTLKLVIYVVVLGVVPSVFVGRVKIEYADVWKEAFSRIKLFVLSLVLIVAMALVFGGFYASFLREHKSLRYYANPSYYIYSAGKYLSGFVQSKQLALQSIGLDAHLSPEDLDRELIILVVGESARADRFSLNGYTRETNPLLKKENVINFSNFWSCSTSTAVSVPCMFSISDQSEYDDEKARSVENVLDVMKHAGVNVLWLDNNSDSKGVASRVSYMDERRSDNNPVCDVECRDEGMLSSLPTYIDEHQQGDIFIVLHQMGNHGPAYYKRYPAHFEKFLPTCKTNQLEECSKEELDNTYDNAILYTDYFLSKVIQLLKSNSSKFHAAMFYVSDHGESLGEHGVYLHGLPNLIAPDAQRHVPAIMWIGDKFKEIDRLSLVEKRNRKYSHDNIFHTLLGFMEIETVVYDEKMDITHGD